MFETKKHIADAVAHLENKIDLSDEVINLDCYSRDPMDYRALEWYFSRLAAYCESKRRAMEHRLGTGGIMVDIEAAISWERSADEIYRKLPQWAKW